MAERRQFLQSLCTVACGASLVSGPAAGEITKGRRDDHEVADWVIHYTIDVSRDGEARITTQLDGSEIPGWVRIRTQRTRDFEVVDGESALSHGEYSSKWDTSVTEAVTYAVQLGHLKLGLSQMAVLDESVIFRDRELAPVGSWEGGLDALPREHRVDIVPPDGWSALSPGREVGPATYEVYPSIRVKAPLRDLFAVGDFTVETATVDGTELRVAELPSADGPPVEDVAALLADTQPVIERYFGRAARYPRAAVVVPTDVHPNGGFARDNSFLVSGNKPLYDVDTGGSTYVHEFAHTFQRYGGPQWHVEGLPAWLQMLALSEAGEVSEDEAIQMLRVWSTESDHDVGDPVEAPANQAQHTKGAAVYAALDIDIRARTDGAEDIGSLVSRVNDQRFADDYAIDRSAALDALQAVTGVDYTPFLERFVDGPTYPTAVLSEGFSVSSPSTVWGSGVQLAALSVASDDVRAGEPVTLVADVANTGDIEAGYTLELSVDGEVVAAATVSLEPNETATVEFDYTFETAGPHQVSVGDRTLGVTVAEPLPEFAVTDASVSHDERVLYRPVAVTVVVENAGDGDGHWDLPLSVDGERIDSTAVWVPAGESETVSFVVRFEVEGEHSVAVGDVEAGTVTVHSGESTGSAPGTDTQAPGATGTPGTRTATPVTASTSADGPGFGWLAGATGLGAAGYALKRWRDDEE